MRKLNKVLHELIKRGMYVKYSVMADWYLVIAFYPTRDVEEIDIANISGTDSIEIHTMPASGRKAAYITVVK